MHRNLHGCTVAACALLASACVDLDAPAHATTSSATSVVTLDDRLAACAKDPRVLVGAVSIDVCAGADLFFREAFNGNGRSCASCHPVDNNFTIEPAFIATLAPDDPLFVAENDPALAGLELPEQMRTRGLILENADGFGDDPTRRFVLRSVPHNLSMGTSVDRAPGDTVNPPVHRTGWSGDGAPGAGALRDFQTGAIIQHYPQSLDRVAGVDFRLATDPELDRIDLFMRRVGRTNELTLASVVMSDAGAEAGRALFLGAGRCNACHANAGANAGFGGGGNRNFNTGVESARNAALAAFPRDGGFQGAPANPDGSFGNGTFNTPPLVEAADTGPFFHTDTTVSGASAFNTPTATTIEEAVAFYDTPAFNTSPGAAAGTIDLDATQIADIGRFLRGINASFNAQQAIGRLDASRAIVLEFHNKHLATQKELLRLANVEITDAIDVLGGASNLNAASRVRLLVARSLVDHARSTSSAVGRAVAIEAARSLVSDAATRIGTGLAFAIGEGNVMF
jgi:mono/diheme cytochrome c family protein